MLNAALDTNEFARMFHAHGRVLIRDVLTEETAERLEHCLRKEVPWGLATLIGGEGRTVRADELADMQPRDWQQLMHDVQAGAREGYQFLYNTYMMVTAWKERRDPALYLHRFLAFLNSEPVLDFARMVTGYSDIAKADAQATRYLPGHFLRLHNDIHQAGKSDSRRAAYVVNLTRDWKADWGGLLEFLDNDGRVEETWIPAWNALAMFKVPTWHCVSCVAPYAAAPRLAITGWFRTH